MVAHPLVAERSRSGDDLIELLLDARAAPSAALVLVAGSERSAPIWFDAPAGEPPRLRTVVDARDVCAGAGYVVLGARSALGAAIASVDGPGLAEAAARGGPRGVRVERVVVDAVVAPPDPEAIARAARLFDAGDPTAALDLLERTRASAPDAMLARLEAAASEAAFEAGRVYLARRIAERGLASKVPRSVEEDARLLRALVLAKSDGPDVTEPPLERERLRTTEAQRDARERLLDAALDLRVAERLDRAAPLEHRARDAADRFLTAAGALPQAATEEAGFAGAICRAAAFLPADEGARATEALARGASLAERAPRVADRVECAIRAGDVARDARRFEEAEGAYGRARDTLSTLPLPRERREAYYSSATVAAARGDFVRAYALARQAFAAIDDLLEAESDLDAREALLATTVGYYAEAAGFAIRAGMPADAIAAAESVKAQGYAMLLRGGGELEESALGEWLIGGKLAAPGSVEAIDARAKALGPDDAALSYAFIGADERGVHSVAICVLTRDGARGVRVPFGAAFLQAFHELPLAVKANDAVGAAAWGKTLYDTFLAPAMPWLAEKHRLFLSLQPTLNKLPWGALHDGAHFLAERFALARVPPLLVAASGARDDRAVVGREAHARWLLALDPAHPPLPRLPGVEAMTSGLVDQLHPEITLVGDDATPERFLDGLSRVDAVLYAGHAQYDPARPARSALLVAPSPSGQDRIDAARLLATHHTLDLVLLVGCETGPQYSKRAKFSDELIGLPRALLVGGARHVVGTLWTVLERDSEDFVRAMTRERGKLDAVSAFYEAERCLARGECNSRGIGAWGAFVLDAR